MYPGSPDEAAMTAWKDACCDHSGEGIYAELFTAAVEAAAFVVSDIRMLINIGLAKIPEGCRVARAVNLALKCYDENLPFEQAWEQIVKDSDDLGWFQAPGNIGFVILALVYGEGDFGKSIILAVNCGDDTDCTAGTVGAILGIVHGFSGIPEKWTEPIGDTIQTTAINTNKRNLYTQIPETVTELTDRTIVAAERNALCNRAIPQFTGSKTSISEKLKYLMTDRECVDKRLALHSEYEWSCKLPCAGIKVEYPAGPYLSAGDTCKLQVKVSNYNYEDGSVRLRFHLPSDWQCDPFPEISLLCGRNGISSFEVELLPGTLKDAFIYIPLEVRFADRFVPYTVSIPFMVKSCMKTENPAPSYHDYFDQRDRAISCIAKSESKA